MASPQSGSRESRSTSPTVFLPLKSVNSLSPTRRATRNMVTGASTADLAVILIDARKGVLTQTRRHSYLAHLLGIRNIVLAVNKMDLVEYDQEVFDKIVAAYRGFATSIGIMDFMAIPISGFKGDNITARSEHMRWYGGVPLIAHLENVPIDVSADQAKSFRMPV